MVVIEWFSAITKTHDMLDKILPLKKNFVEYVMGYSFYKKPFKWRIQKSNYTNLSFE